MSFNFGNILSIELTLTCNTTCIFCSRNSNTCSGLQLFDKENLEKYFKNPNNLKGVQTIEFGGGDSGLVPDLFRLGLKLAKQNNKQCCYITNGRTFANLDFCQEFIPQLDCIKISLHSLDPSTYEYLTNADFLTMQKALVNLKTYTQKYKVPVQFNFVILKSNYQEIIPYFQYLADEFFPDLINYSHPFVAGRMTKNINEYISYNEIIPDLLKVGYLSQITGIEVGSCNLPACTVYPFHETFHVYKRQGESDFTSAKIILRDLSTTTLDSTQIDLDNCWERDLKKRVKLSNCQACLASPYCYGVEPFYKRLFNNIGIHPILKDYE